jgi:O-antigen ligase
MAWKQQLSVLVLLDGLTEAAIYFMIIFGPWAFGTTQPWAIQVMNFTGYGLGAVFCLKWLMRRAMGDYFPSTGWSAGRTLNWSLAGLTLAILGYCLISAVNARATYRPTELSFLYHPIISWLPHSYDAEATWNYFYMYLGLALFFWAMRGWLMEEAEQGFDSERLLETSEGRAKKQMRLPPRLRRLLWVLSINGAVLGLVSILQRLDGTNKLLWLVEPTVNKEVEKFFGPYAYRGNAAQYFNLVWPAALALWWLYQRARTDASSALAGIHRHHLLLLAVLIMGICPILSTSRGGAIVMVALSVLTFVVLLLAQWRQHWATKVGLFVVFALTVTLGVLLSWEELGPRMEVIAEGYQGRESIFDTGRRMAADNPWFGTGPGSFNNLFQLYRSSYQEFWPGQLHNDWLETRITFGWTGLLLLLSALGVCLARWFARGGIHGNRYFVMLLWCALAGCLMHARFDFPLQIYSVLFVFLLHCAILSTLTRH